MRSLYIVLLSVFFCLTNTVMANDVPAISKVSAVTVFADRATVTRSATVTLPKGASTIVLTGLPSRLFQNSLRVEGNSQAKVMIGALESKRVSSVSFVVPKENELYAKIQKLQDQQALNQADRMALAQKRIFLQTLSKQAAKREGENIAVMNIKPEQWAQSAGMIETQMKGTLRSLALKDVAIREINKEIENLKNELAGLRTGAKTSIALRIPVDCKRDALFSLSVTYQLPNAGWAPIYDARLDTKTGAIRLLQFGAVSQRTGEDWTDVKLTLSTAQPARGVALSPLHPMWVSFQKARRHYGDKVGLSATDMSKRSNIASQVPMEIVVGGAEGGGMLAELKEASFVPSMLRSTDYVAEYDIAGVNTVLADGSSRKVMIGELKVSSKLVAKIKPQLDPASAYLVAVTKLAGEAPLLPGLASLFRDGAFIGSTTLPLLRSGEDVDLGFGIDDKIILKTRLIKDEFGQTGMIAKKNTRTWQNLLEIENLHSKPVLVAVLQTVPASREEDINIRLDESYTTAGFDKNADKIAGQMRWVKELKSRGKWEISLGWHLSWPKGKRLSGVSF